MTMTPTIAYRTTVALIWALALWHAWVARGLFVDGSGILFSIVLHNGYVLFYEARLYVMALTQMPAVTAVQLGVTDTQTLARLFSAGLFFVPTIFYHASLHRVRHDPALLAAVVCAIGVGFVPTSFFIIGEYNTVSAAILFAGVILAVGSGASVRDGVLLAATAALLARSYETMFAYGLLMAALTVWRMRIAGWQGLASLLYGAAVACFLAGVGVAGYWLVYPSNPSQAAEEAGNFLAFWQNLQFALPLAAIVVVAIGALVAPRLLQQRGLYIGAGLFLVAAAICPLLWLTDSIVRPLAKTHYHSRMMAGVFVAGIVVVAWLYALRATWTPRALKLLAEPRIARRFLLFQMVAILSALPCDLLLTQMWSRNVAAFQATMDRRGGLIHVEDTPLVRMPHSAMLEDWSLPSLSVMLRRRVDDAQIVQPRGFSKWQPYDPTKPLPARFGQYTWGDTRGDQGRMP